MFRFRLRLTGSLERYQLFIGCGIMVASSLCLWPALNADMQGDIRLYDGMANDLLGGKLPYRDRVVEYPPYAILIFLLPRLFGENNYVTFPLLAFLADWLVKLSLLIAGLRHSKTARALLPLLLYSLAVPFLQFFYLQRYDVFPALVSVAGIWLFSTGKYFSSGLAIAIGIGVKLYPAVFVPPLLVLAMRQGGGRRFTAGLAGGMLPIALLSFVVPWWRFAQFHGARGLQVESLYASVLWLGKWLGVAQLDWKYTSKWFEVHGVAASVVLPWARAGFAVAVIFSTAFASWAARWQDRPSAPRIARLLLVPLLGFIAFNQVLSPQYLVWLLPLAALGSLEGKVRPMLALVFAALLTPVIFPSLHGNYFHGLNLPETLVLVLRNLILIGVWVSLLFEFSSGAHVPVLTSIAKQLATPRVRCFLKFCVVGGSGVIVDTAVLHVLVEGCGWNIELGKVCAAETALLSNFFWNDTWTFRDMTSARASLRAVIGRLLKFHLICGIGIAMAVLLLRLFYSGLGMNLYLANVLAILLVTLWNFSMNAAFNWRMKTWERRRPAGKMPGDVRANEMPAFPGKED